MTVPLYDIAGLRHGYGTGFALDIPHLTIERGGALGLYGPNGSGKSTLLRILAFLERHDEGTIRYDGEAVIPASIGRRREVTMLLQEPYLLKRSVFENVVYGLRVRGDTDGLAGRVHAALEAVGLAPDEFAARNWSELSGGEAKRTALAARLALAPEVLILDEPTATVDRLSASFIRDAIATARRVHHTTLIVASHDIVWLAGVTDSVARLYEGRIVESGADNIIGGPWEDGPDGLFVRTLADGQLIAATRPPSRAARAMLHSTNIIVARDRPEGVSAQNILAGAIAGMSAERESGSIRLDIAVGGLPFVAHVTPRAAETLGLLPGRDIWVVFKASSLHWH